MCPVCSPMHMVPDSRGDYPRVRGSDPDIFLDGMRYSDAFQFNEPRIDPYTLSRVEVLRGPASMLYGATPIAGLINLISKRPLDVAKREVEVVYGSFDQKEFRTDLTGPLTPGGELLYRFIGVGRLANSQTDYVPDDRYVVNPSITWRPTAGTTWSLIGLQQKDSTGSSTAFLPHEGTRFPGPNGFIPVNRFTSEPIFDKYETTTSAITSLFRAPLQRCAARSFEHALPVYRRRVQLDVPGCVLLACRSLPRSGAADGRPLSVRAEVEEEPLHDR